MIRICYLLDSGTAVLRRMIHRFCLPRSCTEILLSCLYRIKNTSGLKGLRSNCLGIQVGILCCLCPQMCHCKYLRITLIHCLRNERLGSRQGSHIILYLSFHSNRQGKKLRNIYCTSIDFRNSFEHIVERCHQQNKYQDNLTLKHILESSGWDHHTKFYYSSNQMDIQLHKSQNFNQRNYQLDKKIHNNVFFDLLLNSMDNPNGMSYQAHMRNNITEKRDRRVHISQLYHQQSI